MSTNKQMLYDPYATIVYMNIELSIIIVVRV